MARRFNSERKINKNGFKIKIGTTNRLTPNTVYIDLGGYIIPQNNKNSYIDDVMNIDADLKKRLKEQLNNNIFSKNYICVFETAHERMKQGKSSYISLQYHLKQNGNLLTEDILNETQTLSDSIINDLSQIVYDNGFLIKNDIYSII